MADAKKGIPAVGGAASAAAATGKKGKYQGKKRMLNGLEVRPFLYNAKATGGRKYYGGYLYDTSKKDATVWDQAVKDSQGEPVPFSEIGDLI